MTLSSAKSRARGQALEWLAAVWLIFKGYRIIARNFRVPGGEIDVIALSPERWLGKPVLCFIEVRGRDSVADAVESVDQVKLARLQHAAAGFLGRYRHFAGMPRRFDLIAAPRQGWPKHFHRAFDP